MSFNSVANGLLLNSDGNEDINYSLVYGTALAYSFISFAWIVKDRVNVT